MWAQSAVAPLTSSNCPLARTVVRTVEGASHHIQVKLLKCTVVTVRCPPCIWKTVDVDSWQLYSNQYPSSVSSNTHYTCFKHTDLLVLLIFPHCSHQQNENLNSAKSGNLPLGLNPRRKWSRLALLRPKLQPPNTSRAQQARQAPPAQKVTLTLLS